MFGLKIPSLEELVFLLREALITLVEDVLYFFEWLRDALISFME